MAAIIEYFFALNSPWSYLGAAPLKDVAARHGAEVQVKPVKLGEIFAKTGGTPLPQRPLERRNYRLLELERWSKHLGVQMVLQPRNFPSDETTAAHLVIAAQEDGLDALALATGLRPPIVGRGCQLGRDGCVARHFAPGGYRRGQASKCASS